MRGQVYGKSGSSTLAVKPACVLPVCTGTFGQSECWNLSQPSTYQHPKLPQETIFDTQGLPSIDTSSVRAQERAGSDVSAVDTGMDKSPPVYRSESVVSIRGVLRWRSTCIVPLV